MKRKTVLPTDTAVFHCAPPHEHVPRVSAAIRVPPSRHSVGVEVMASPGDDITDDDHQQQPQPPKVRAELPYLFEKELTLKQNKRIYIVEGFAATERADPIAGKFYSKFNEADISDFAQRQRHWQLAKEARAGSRMHREFPALESQTYGWIPPTGVGVMALRQINCVRAPKRRCDITVYGEKLNCERVTERPKFTGERFYLR